MASRAKNNDGIPNVDVQGTRTVTSPVATERLRGAAEYRSLRASEVRKVGASLGEDQQVESTSRSDGTSLPTFTLDEIKEDLAKGDSRKMSLAYAYAYPADRPYVQDFTVLIQELAHRMIKAVPEDIKDLSADEIAIHLVDRPTVNAYITSSQKRAHSIFINRGLIAEFLIAPEFKDKDLCIDALAGVVAHEICHANFARQYKGRSNSMIQEEYCDILPAKMLQRIGLRPESMSRLCDLFARVENQPDAKRRGRDEPHASHPIRKEIFEKGSWEDYERERRRATVAITHSLHELPREEWKSRLLGIVELSHHDRIVHPIRHELRSKGFETAAWEEKLATVAEFVREHKNTLRDGSAYPLLAEVCSLTHETLASSPPPRHTLSQHPLLVDLSVLLYQHKNSHAAYHHYLELRFALGSLNFGALEYADTAYKALVTASSMEEVRAALGLCNQLLTYPVQPRADDEWASEVLTATIDRLRSLFTREDFEKLKWGKTIPFPFGAHRDFECQRPPGMSRPELDAWHLEQDLFRRFCSLAGISSSRSWLKQPTTPDHHDGQRDPRNQLMEGTGIKSCSAFTISEKDGIALLFPHRELIESTTDFSAAIETEIHFARFLAVRGEPLLDEVPKLTLFNLLSFAQQHAHLIMPQLHPVGILSKQATHDSHRLADAVVKRFYETCASDSESCQKDTKHFLLELSWFHRSLHKHVYRTYHQSVLRCTDITRVDPNHPLPRAILENRGGHLTGGEQAVALSALHGFYSSEDSRLTGKSTELRDAFAAVVGGEEKLKELLGVDLSRPPAQFIERLSRITTRGSQVYVDNYFAYPDEPVRELRAHYIREYLDKTPIESFTIEELHTLRDLCLLSGSSEVLRQIQDIAAKNAHDPATLSDEEFINTYQHLVAMGVTDSFLSVDKQYRAEVLRRLDVITDSAARASFVRDICHPRPFTCGERKWLLIFSVFEDPRFKNIQDISSLYTPRTADPNFEERLVQELVAVHAAEIREIAGVHYDDRSPRFATACRNLLTSMERSHLPANLRARALHGIADELLTQSETSDLFRKNLTTNERHQSQLTFANFMMATHQFDGPTNWSAVQAHNALIDLREHSRKELRDTLFQFLIERSPTETASRLSDLLLNELEGFGKNWENPPELFTQLGIQGVRPISSPQDRERQKELVDYHLKALHQRFIDLDVKAKGAALSIIAVDNRPSEESFNEFKSTALLPRILPQNGPYNELLLKAVDSYFDFYSNAVHHKYMVACAIIANAQHEAPNVSDLAKVGLVAKSFLGAHGPAGYKLLQRIRNHPSTPQEIKDTLHNVLDETISLPRWTIHQRIKEFGPADAWRHWVGKANAGSLCLSVPITKEDGSESVLSMLHPGAHVDSLYWLQNFKTIASHLAEIKPELGVLVPMTEQTRRLIENETDFANSTQRLQNGKAERDARGIPERQQEIAERGYTYTMDFPSQKLKIVSSCAPLVGSEAKPHADFMKSSGSREAGRVAGRSLLDMVRELREKSGDGTWSKEQALERFTILKTVAFSVLANEIRLIATGKGKDHDRHPGNFLIEVRPNPQGNSTIVAINNFDFGCTDTSDPAPEIVEDLGIAFTRAIEKTSLLRMALSPRSLMDNFSKSLFERGTFRPELASIPCGILAAMGAQERVVVNGKRLNILDNGDILRAFKAGIEAATLPEVLQAHAPRGVKGWLIRKILQLADSGVVRFTQFSEP